MKNPIGKIKSSGINPIYERLPDGEKRAKYSKEVKALKSKRGVYIIRSPKGIVRYVGATGYSLYTSVTRRFQGWTDRNFQRVTYPAKKGYTVEVYIVRGDPKRVRIFEIEAYLIKKLKPRDNIELMPMQGPTETKRQYYIRKEKEEREAYNAFIKAGGGKVDNEGNWVGDRLLDLIFGS